MYSLTLNTYSNSYTFNVCVVAGRLKWEAFKRGKGSVAADSLSGLLAKIPDVLHTPTIDKLHKMEKFMQELEA